jgi:hypothetical protein
MTAYTLYREDLLGNRYKLDTFKYDEVSSMQYAMDAVDEMEDSGVWPEGHEAVLVSSDGQEWLYSDEWEEL